MKTNCKIVCNGNRLCLIGSDILPRIGEWISINGIIYEVQHITHRFVGAGTYKEDPVEIILNVRQLTITEE